MGGRRAPRGPFASRAVATSVFALLLALLFATALLTLLIGLSRTVYPHDVGQYDASIWAPADLIAHGQSPYFKSIALAPPYVVAPYGPVYYAVIAVGLRAFGDQLWFGRGLSLVCLGMCALLVYAILWRAAHPSYARRVGLVGVGLLVAQYPVQAFIGVQRPDLVAMALALSGLALAFADTASSPKRALLTGASVGILLALAILVRQTLFLPLPVALAWFVLRRDRARLIGASVAAAVTLAAVVGFLTATSHGGFLWHAVRLQTSVPFSAHLALEHFDGFVGAPATLCTLALLATGVVWDRRCRARGGLGPDAERREGRLLRRLLLAYLAAAVAVAAAASGKAGSNINYWLEVALVLSMLTPLVWAPSLSATTATDSSPSSTTTVFDSLVAVTLAASLVTGAREAHGQLLQWRALPYTNEIVSNLGAITSAGDPVIADYPDIAVSARRRYYFNDIATYALSPLLSPLLLRVERSKRIKAIVTIAATPPAGYVPVCLTHTPTGVYVVRLYVLAAEAHLSKAHCAIA
jgi:hypothetical protein